MGLTHITFGSRWGVCRDLLVQLPNHDSTMDVSNGGDDRQHVHAQALGERPRNRNAVGRAGTSFTAHTTW